MPAGEKRDQEAFDHDVLADDNLGNLLAQFLDEHNDRVGPIRVGPLAVRWEHRRQIHEASAICRIGEPNGRAEVHLQTKRPARLRQTKTTRGTTGGGRSTDVARIRAPPPKAQFPCLFPCSTQLAIPIWPSPRLARRRLAL